MLFILDKCIIGTSGCGKSTLLSLLAGIKKPMSGAIVMDGKEIKEPGQNTGVVFQHYSLFPWMSAKENLSFGIKQANKNWNKEQINTLAEQYLKTVGLSEAARRYPSHMSNGMQQHVAVARVFAMDPEILLLDEPFSALDAKSKAELNSLLLNLWGSNQKKKTIVFITHDIDEAIILSDRIIALSQDSGDIKQIIEVGFERPRDRSLLTRQKEYFELRNNLFSLLSNSNITLI